MQQQSPTKSIIIKNECSSDNQNKFEAIITLKILANETGKEIWKDVCLTTERDTIGKMVKHVQEKFIPAEYLNKSLKLRNVTIFSERFGLEVSVAVDGLATDGAKYTANFLNSQNLTERAVDQRSSTTSNLQKKSEDQGKSLTDVEKKYKEKMDLFMKTERDLLKANKQKQTALDDLKLAEKNAKEKSEALKEAQNALDKVRDEKKRLQIDVAQLEKSKKDLGNYLKDMREMSAKKTKDLDKLNKDLEKLEKKRKGMLHQMDVYKKELDAELDGMNKLNTTREKTNSEIENLKNEKQKCKTSLESLKKSEEECRKNLEHLQEEEKKFYLMLNELKEHVHIHQTQLQELQGRENEKNLNENFGLVYGQNGNNNFGEVQQNFNEQSEFNCKGGQQQRGDGNEFDKTENSHQFSGTKATDKDTYFNENLWKRSASSFVQGKILGQRNVFNNGSESSSVDTFSPEVKRERKGETKKFTIEAQSPPTSSHFNQNSMQNRAVYIESEELGNPGDGELFSYVDNGPIFGHQNNLLSTACWQEQQPTTIIMTGPPQISPNSIQPLNSVLVNSVKDQPIYSFNSSSSSSGQFRRGTTNRICVVNANNNVRTCGKYRNRQLPILHAERNRSRKMRRGERDHKIFPKRFNISPIRGPIPSSSTSGTYGNCPHSVESSIMKRITIEDQPNKCSSSSIHSRLSFDRK